MYCNLDIKYKAKKETKQKKAENYSIRKQKSG